jgi:hypothetical protein
MSKPLTNKMTEALALAASRRSGCISCGDRFPTSASTLRALRKRGMLKHVATQLRPFHRVQYRITDAGRAAIADA